MAAQGAYQTAQNGGFRRRQNAAEFPTQRGAETLRKLSTLSPYCPGPPGAFTWP
jgi:hypothetical protein